MIAIFLALSLNTPTYLTILSSRFLMRAFYMILRMAISLQNSMLRSIRRNAFSSVLYLLSLCLRSAWKYLFRCAATILRKINVNILGLGSWLICFYLSLTMGWVTVRMKCGLEL